MEVYMKTRKLKDNIYYIGAVDWDRRLFDSLIPLPDGTTYNSYIVKGSEKTALIDTVDPPMVDILMKQLKDFPKIDYVIAHHAEQDHSGVLPEVLKKYSDAILITSPKGKGMMMDLLHIEEKRFKTVEDGESISLGDKTLRFIHTPWVHWPETMSTYLEEDRILFSCDFFGSHYASNQVFAEEKDKVYLAAKRYYAEIMMPYANHVAKDLEKISDLKIDIIAPSHGPLYNDPAFIIDAYKDWVLGKPKNLVVIPYISMHGSTAVMVERLVASLTAENIVVEQFDLTSVDLGKLAMSLVDAATIVIGTPTVLSGPHPNALYAVALANALRPKARFVSLVGSYGWGTKIAEQIVGLIPNLKVEVIDPVICKGLPREADLSSVDALAAKIVAKHKEAGLM
jgi:flavorubredoxin